MKTVASLPELRLRRSELPGVVGFVPTMGYLHDGHLSLVRRAREVCDSVVVSIFVNPTQFGPSEDLAAYPRDIPRDMDLLEKERVDLVWHPTPEILYPGGFQTWVTVEEVSKPLEGAMRPGHFRGVATVVTKLFNSIQPHKAYFGQKDAQQAIVIRRMVDDLNFPIEIVLCPTQREADGLAMSSRNVYLNPKERNAAPLLFMSLKAAQEAFGSGERNAARLKEIVSNLLAVEPLIHTQYISCADPETLAELENVTDVSLLSLAALIGNTRLIDNVYLGR